ncbi:MAG: hypothetical protein QW061_03045 [Candidatus Rehaiarchaeum fermentans]|uniref:DUF6955 family protein n=1 Tax=Saccharolobus sp. TaxID=2100761 RepID=UPI002411DDAD|nr:hypothetical protein [Candidatus Rehaiarchaeum fermentans]
MKIYIWLSEELSKKLDELGLNYANEVLGGMKRIEIEVEDNIVNKILELLPYVKVDTSTTNSIELLPKSFKSEILKTMVEKRLEPKQALLEVIDALEKRINS